MEYKIYGTTMQTLDVQLVQGESMYTESGGMAWMMGNIDMTTDTRGGLLKGLGRKLAGESLFMTTYTCKGGAGMITLAMVLTTIGVPTEGVALVLGVDRLLDMFRTTTNVIGDATATVLVATTRGEQLAIRTAAASE